MNHSKRRTRSSGLHVWNYWLYWTALFCAIGSLIAFGIIGARHNHHTSARTSAALSADQTHARADLASVPQRRFYPYSVIPGGVENAQELRNAIALDPLVAHHYSDFDVSRAHIIRLRHDERMYVSYRLYNQIYWTKRRLTLYKGETLITDGTHQARTRCGNRLSTTPIRPVSPKEPSAPAMNVPLTRPVLVAENPRNLPEVRFDPVPVLSNPFVEMPHSNPPVSRIPPAFFPIVGGGPPSQLPLISPPPVAVPEPRALWLILSGFLALAVVTCFARRKASNRSHE